MLPMTSAGTHSTLTPQARNLLATMLDAIPDPVMLLDGERRVVMANTRLLNTFGVEPDTIGGQRPGEALGCLFATESPQGCGAGIHCTVCGAMRSIISCRESGGSASQECQVLLGPQGDITLDMSVTSTATVIDGMPLTVCVLRDVTEENRRSSLERIFYHDVLNMAGGIQGIAELIGKLDGVEKEEEVRYKQWLVDLSRRLTEEIRHQRKLVAAERGEFKPELGIVPLDDLLREVQALYSSHNAAEGRAVELGELCGSHVMSDLAILTRILGNLVKNALEATPRGGTVTLSCCADDYSITISVHNPGVIPEDVQLQIFRRSFSTKGEIGRGLGTYSVRLFGERYLKGRVGFTSTEEDGTTFFITLPKGGASS